MTINLFGEIQCTAGWELRCGHAISEDCTCACGGKNHAKYVKRDEQSTAILKAGMEVHYVPKWDMEVSPNRTFHTGEALTVLKSMSSESVDCVVTSPPYWGLRDYGVAGQIGLEPVEEYITKLCDIFDEVKRVLKKTGTCFVNLGDTYGNGNKGKGFDGKADYAKGAKPPKIFSGRHKTLLQIPSRFAIAMEARGWILRNEIIWHKPNAMPSSAKDRFTVDFEKVFFFTKKEKYFFEQQYQALANSTKKDVRLFKKDFTENRRHRAYPGNMPQQGSGMLKPTREDARNMRSVWHINTTPSKVKDVHFAVFPEALAEIPILSGCPKGGVVLDPFMGTGTVGVVALRHERKFVGIEINKQFSEKARERIDLSTVL